MPIYEYRCLACDVRFDAMRPMSKAESPATCPRCGLSAGRCASLFSARSSNGKAIAGDKGGSCSDCSAHSCATCGSS
ncbi:MAG: zinc ribbon domain-containing protein [Ardenticatenales bacterium]|nr:zinc ribbon domain-containing protein [Ardenticatenales bacterium]